MARQSDIDPLGEEPGGSISDSAGATPQATAIPAPNVAENERAVAVRGESELIAKLRGDNLKLTEQLEQIKAELTTQKMQHAVELAQATKRQTARPLKPGEFDENRPHRLVKDFRSSGKFGMVAYEAGRLIKDPYVLRLLHHQGAELSPA